MAQGRDSSGRFTKTYTVNLDGNMAERAKSAGKSIQGLALSLGNLQEKVLGALIVNRLFESVKSGIEYVAEANERVEQLSSSFGALSGQGPEAGRKMLESIRSVAKELPQTERQIEDIAQGLMSVGVTDMSQLRAQLYAISGAEALVAGGGERVRGILMRMNEASEKGTKLRFNVAQLAGTGLTEGDLLKQLGMTPQQLDQAKKQATLTGEQIAVAITDALNEKAKGPLARMMGDISVRFRKGVDTISHLFEGIKLDKLADEVTQFFGIFDSDMASGQALKGGLVAVLQSLGDTLGWVLHQVTLFVLDGIILVLRLRGFWLDHFEAIKAGTIGALVGVAAVLLGIFGPAIVATTIQMGALAIATIIAIGPWILLGVAIAAVVAALVYFWPQIKKAIAVVEEWAQKGWDAAVNFVAGIVGGLVNGVTSVVDAVKNLGKASWNALTDFWKVHSPSRLTFELGANIAEGQAQGIESKDARVQTAASDTLAAMPQGHGRRAAAAGGIGVGGFTWNGDLYVVAKDSETAHEVVDEVEDRMSTVFERWALSQGLAPT